MRMGGRSIVDDALRLVNANNAALVALLGKSGSDGSRPASNVKDMVCRPKMRDQECRRVMDGARFVAREHRLGMGHSVGGHDACAQSVEW
jgi:hypothetical protein